MLLTRCIDIDKVALAQAQVQLLQQSLNVGLGVAANKLLDGDPELGDGASEVTSQVGEDVVRHLDRVAVQDVGDGDGRVDGDSSTLAVRDVVGDIDVVLVRDVSGSDCNKSRQIMNVTSKAGAYLVRRRPRRVHGVR